MSQRMDALAKAQARRMALAKLRRELRCLDRRRGMLRAAALIVQPGGDAGAMPVVSLLSCVRWIGPVRAGEIVRSTRAGRRRVRDLTPVQRERIASRLWDMASRVKQPARAVPSAPLASRRGTPYDQAMRRTA
jgi:hypothetical protein